MADKKNEKIAPKVITATSNKAVKLLVEAGATEIGAKHVARVTAEETAKYAAAVASQKGAEAGFNGLSGFLAVNQAARQYVTNVAASQASAQMWVKVAGRSVGIVTTPIAECIVLRLDGEKHGGAEYAEAGVRGAVSAASGVAATAATSALLASLMTGAASGAAAGSVVPGPGTVVGGAIGLAGAAAGAGASFGVNSWMKRNNVLERVVDTMDDLQSAIDGAAYSAGELVSKKWQRFRLRLDL
ncbi:hypothetical protein [Streptomyces sp. NPDC059979]|uniref:hypothetical protein n=1 Tax=unclassified Streptomyces TaxID=2593676 RepID=UPI00364C4F26